MEIFVIVVGIFGLLIVIAITLSVVRMIVRRTPEVKPPALWAKPSPNLQAAPTPQPHTPAPAMQPPASFLPTLPGTCANCHGPINMKEVTWTGPMSAACPYCGSSIDIKWNKLGD